MSTQLSNRNFGQFLHHVTHEALQTLGRSLWGVRELGKVLSATLYVLTKSHPDRMSAAKEIKEEFQCLLSKKS